MWRYPRTTIAVCLLLTLFLVPQMSKLKIVFSAEELAGEGIASADELKDIKARYEDGVSSLFMISPPQGEYAFSAEQLCAVRKWYSFHRNAIPELKASFATFDFKAPVRLSDSRITYRNLLDLDCNNPQLLVDPRSVQATLNESPFGFAHESKNRLSLLFQFTFEDSKTSKFGSFDPALIKNLRHSVEHEVMPLLPKAEIHWVGPADYQWYILEGFSFAKYINLGMILFLMIGLRFFFGNWRTGFLYCGSLVLATVWVFGFKGLLGSSYDVLSTGLMLILGISSLEDFTFVSYEQMKGRSWRKSIRLMVLPAFYTSLTTMVGFLSLYVSDVDAIRRMGIWAAFGVFAEWVIIFILYPCIFMHFKNFQRWVRAEKATGTLLLKSFTAKALPKAFSYASLLVYPLAIWAFNGISYNEAPHRVFPPDQEYSRGIAELEESRGWTGVVSLIFEKEMPYADADKILQELLQSPEAQGQIIKYESPWNIAEWLAQRGAIDGEEGRTHFNISRLHNQYVDSEDRARVLLYVRDTAVEPIEALQKKAATVCAGRCHLGGEIVAYSEFSGLVPKTLVDSLSSSLVLVALIIWWLAYAQKKTYLVPSLLMSSFWGPFLMIFLIGSTHSTLDFWKSIFASILVGLTGDNAIQYLFASRRKEIDSGILDRGGASILTGCLMAVTSLIYLFSYFSSPRTFGVILCVGLLSSLVGDLWLLNGLLPSQEEKKRLSFQSLLGRVFPWRF